jgi:hypothetical protein
MQDTSGAAVDAGTAAWRIGAEGARLNDGHYRPATASDATNRSLVAL